MMSDTFVHGFLRQLFKTWSDVESSLDRAQRGPASAGVPNCEPVYIGGIEAANLPEEANDGLTRLAMLVGDEFVFKVRDVLAQSGKEVYLVWLDPQLTLDRWAQSGDGLVLRHALPVSLTPFPGGVPISAETGRIVSPDSARQ